MTDFVTAIVWLVGSAFALLAAVGVLRMPDVFTRMQASTKASTLGLACLLIGAAVAGLWIWKSVRPAAPPRVARLSFDLPQGSRIVPEWAATDLTFSRDSKTLVYPVNFPLRRVPHTRRIDAALQMGDFASFIRVASIGAFVLLTTPVSGHVIARASYFAGVPLWKGTVLDERRDAKAGPQPDE